MRIVIFALLCLLSSSSVYSQDNDRSTGKQWSMKFDATKLIEPEQNISFAAERWFTKNNNFSYQLQLDYIFDAYTQNNYNSINFRQSGIRAIPEFRFNYSAPDKMRIGYIALQLLNKYTVKHYQEWTEQYDMDSTLYLELKDIRQEKFVIAPHVLIGNHLFLSRNKKMSIDFNFGLGARSRTVKKSADYNTPRTFLNFRDDESVSTISMASNLKLCYFFRK